MSWYNGKHHVATDQNGNDQASTMENNTGRMTDDSKVYIGKHQAEAEAGSDLPPRDAGLR